MKDTLWKEIVRDFTLYNFELLTRESRLYFTTKYKSRVPNWGIMEFCSLTYTIKSSSRNLSFLCYKIKFSVFRTQSILLFPILNFLYSIFITVWRHKFFFMLNLFSWNKLLQADQSKSIRVVNCVPKVRHKYSVLLAISK